MSFELDVAESAVALADEVGIDVTEALRRCLDANIEREMAILLSVAFLFGRHIRDEPGAPAP